MNTQRTNALEAFALYDTVGIGGTKITGDYPGWFGAGYAAFGQRAQHAFFNVRNQSETHLAYCNLETKDQMPFVFHLRSIGLSFQAPPHTDSGQDPSLLEQIQDQLFTSYLPRHVGLKLVVRQDDKLLHTAELAPEGTGPVGLPVAAPGTAAALLQATQITQGVADIGNRWTWPEMISIPRGATYRVVMELSPHAQELLLTMGQGPREWTQDVRGLATIRCSLIGVREVQQRNALHA